MPNLPPTGPIPVVAMPNLLPTGPIPLVGGVSAAPMIQAADQQKLKSMEQLWSIRGKLYDMENFVKRHPGGFDAIMLAQGVEDATTLFESYHPFTDKPEKILKQYLYTAPVLKTRVEDEDSIFYLSMQDKARTEHGHRLTTSTVTNKHGNTSHVDPFFEWNDTPFYNECKRVMKEHFSPKGTETSSEIHSNIKSSYFAIFQTISLLLLMFYSFFQFIAGSTPALTYFPLIYWIIGSVSFSRGTHS